MRMEALKCQFFVLIFISSAVFGLPPSYTEKVDSIPNVCESCFPAIVKWGGKTHCAPAAVSNSLVWLSKNGFPSLQPFHDGNEDEDQARLVNLLGEIMGTSEYGGTSPYNVFLGLKSYLAEKNITYRRMAAEGLREVPSFVNVDANLVKLDWIKAGTLGKNSVWILIGWYKYDPKTDTYHIYDGHWMTVVGYGKDRAGRDDSNILIVHDPAERAQRKNYYPTISILKHGTLAEDNPKPTDQTRSAVSALSITGDVVIKPGADYGIIEGAYRLEL